MNKKGSIMRIRRLLRQTEFHIFLFCLFFVLLCWPFIAIPEKKGPVAVFIYLLMAWVFMISLLFIICINLGNKTYSEKNGGEGDSKDV